VKLIPKKPPTELELPRKIIAIFAERDPIPQETGLVSPRKLTPTEMKDKGLHFRGSSISVGGCRLKCLNVYK
jgi:hypothetical protein